MIYEKVQAQLVFLSDSIQYVADYMTIHRSTVVRYTATGELFQNRFLISYDPIPEMENRDWGLSR